VLYICTFTLALISRHLSDNESTVLRQMLNIEKFVIGYTEMVQ
jgi:hypothetical protein